MNFGLVFPKYVNKGQMYDFYFGLAIISSCMKQRGFNVFCLNPNHFIGSIEQQLSDFITKNHIDVICTGGMSIHYSEINNVLEASKQIKPDIITVVGGAILTSNPKVACWGIKQIDYGVVGEGEETIIELADALVNNKDTHSIKGLAYFKENKYILTEDRIPVSNLDIIPFPDYEGFGYNEYSKLFYPSEDHSFSVLDEVRFGYIMASRSCPFACTFCYHHHLSKFRKRSLDNVFQEIDYLVKMYNINFLTVADELFSFDKKRMYEFASRIKPYDLKWFAQFRVSDVDKEILETLKDSGLFKICYGIESVSNKILKSMKKHTTKEQIDNALRLTYEAKISIRGNIILGDPEETEETVKECIEWLNTHPEYGIFLDMIRTYPFAPIYKYAISQGLIKDEFKHMKDKFPLVNLTKMSNKRYQELCVFADNFDERNQNHLNGIIIKSKVTSLTSEKENIYSFSVKCSSCGEISEYKNMVQKSFKLYSLVICRHCNSFLYIENALAYHKNYTSYDKIMNFGVKFIKQHVDTNPIIFHVYFVLKDLKRRRLFTLTDKYT